MRVNVQIVHIVHVHWILFFSVKIY